MDTKHCSNCRKTLPLESFHKNRHGRQGRAEWCAECFNSYRRLQAAQNNSYYHNNRKGIARRRSWKLEEKRKGALRALGGKCVRCGYDEDFRALHFDHVNDDGKSHRAAGCNIGNTLYTKIINGVHGVDVQILCANCNLIKEYDRQKRRLAERLATP